MHNFSKINDLLYRGSAPKISDVETLKNKLKINKIISLDKDAGNKINRTCNLLQIEHIIIPIDVSKKSSLLDLLKYDIVKLLDDNSPTFVHCFQGKDRTGLVSAIYREKHDNWTCEEALNEAKHFGFGIGLQPSVIKLFENLIAQFCDHKHEHITGNNDINNADVIPQVGLTSNQTGLLGNSWNNVGVNSTDISYLM